VVASTSDGGLAELLALCPNTPPTRELESVVASTSDGGLDDAVSELLALCPATPRRKPSAAISSHGWKSQVRMASLALLASRSPLPSKCGELSRALPKAARRRPAENKKRRPAEKKECVTRKEKKTKKAVTPKAKKKKESDTPKEKVLNMGRHAVISRAYKQALRIAKTVEGLDGEEAAKKARNAHLLAAIAWDSMHA
jgi:hypothetical protein